MKKERDWIVTDKKCAGATRSARTQYEPVRTGPAASRRLPVGCQNTPDLIAANTGVAGATVDFVWFFGVARALAAAGAIRACARGSRKTCGLTVAGLTNCGVVGLAAGFCRQNPFVAGLLLRRLCDSAHWRLAAVAILDVVDIDKEKPTMMNRNGSDWRRLWALLLCWVCLTGAALLPAQAASTFTPTSAFTDNGDGTVTHQLTSLMWMRCQVGQTWAGATCSGTAATYTFDQAKVLTSNFAGHSDWRLPSPWELVTIVDYNVGNPGPAINETIFPNAPSAYVWSGSPHAGNSVNAWFVSFGDGFASNLNREGNYSVRLVRGGRSPAPLTTPTSDFIDNGGGTTITHKASGLMWMRCVLGQTWTGTACSGAAGSYTWDQARALNNSYEGYADWRMPDIQELTSIVEYRAYGPAVNGTMFPNTPSSQIWSGSPSASNPNAGWGVNFENGEIRSSSRNTAYSVHLVRGTQSVVPVSFALGVIIAGAGSGSVVSSETPAHINCSSVAGSVSGTCSSTEAENASITLSAARASGSTFSGWSGACVGTASTCSLTMDKAQTVTATFAPAGVAVSSTDCTFNWLEDHFSTYLKPSRPTSQTIAPYTFRSYAGVPALLGVSSANNHLYYLSFATGQIDLGQVSTWAAQAGCP